MIEFVKKYGSNVFSQNGEDGILEEVLKRTGIWVGKCVEFGAADGTFCSNTGNLLKKGWYGKLIEGDENLYRQLIANKELPAGKIEMQQGLVTPENVNKIVGEDCDVLSIDIDGNDYNVWKAYTGKPDIVIIEINSSYNTAQEKICDEGTSYKPMTELGISKGYFLLCHTGNLIFIDSKHRKLFPEIMGDGLSNSEQYFNDQWLKK